MRKINGYVVITHMNTNTLRVRKLWFVVCTVLPFRPCPFPHLAPFQTFNNDISVYSPPRLFVMDAPLFSADGDAKHVEEHSNRHQSCRVAAVIFLCFRQLAYLGREIFTKNFNNYKLKNLYFRMKVRQ
jgi:hypothetical protein